MKNTKPVKYQYVKGNSGDELFPDNPKLRKCLNDLGEFLENYIQEQEIEIALEEKEKETLH
jgi:hypothetical protein